MRLAWRRGHDLVRGCPVLAPAQAVHCPPAGAPSLGPAVVSWTTNGMGAHPDRDAAVLHALLEAIERDQLARALPQGWTRAAVGERMLSDAALEGAPRAAAWLHAIRARRFDAHLFDLTPRARGLGIPVAGALLFDQDRGSVPVTAGYCCGVEPDAALLGALLEAAQSRLTDIHGAREDVEGGDLGQARLLRGWCATAAPRGRLEVMPRVQAGSAASAINATVEAVRCSRRARLGVFDLAPPRAGVHVVKIVAPGLSLSELL